MKNNFLYLIWKDPKTRRNFTVGKLTKSEKYTFCYCEQNKAAEEAGWRPLDAFAEEKEYTSDDLFPVFVSRLPDPKRRDIQKILQKYELNEFDAFELLRKSGARLPIDTYEFIDPIFSEEEKIQRDFFIMGIRYGASCEGTCCDKLPTLREEDEVYFKPEPENEYDPFAVRVVTKAGEHLGYVPRYYSQGISQRLKDHVTYSCKILEVNKEKRCSECIKVRLRIPNDD